MERLTKKEIHKEFEKEIMRFRKSNGTNHIRYNDILEIHKKVLLKNLN